jgi:CheY-like chemotaxis protein
MDRPLVVVVIDDLFFMAKIGDAARRADVEVAFVHTEPALRERLASNPALVIFDLNAKALPALELAASIKTAPETRAIPVIGFLSHVQVDLRRQALDAGIDEAMPRSAFSRNLPAILERFTRVNPLG